MLSLFASRFKRTCLKDFSLRIRSLFNVVTVDQVLLPSKVARRGRKKGSRTTAIGLKVRSKEQRLQPFATLKSVDQNFSEYIANCLLCIKCEALLGYTIMLSPNTHQHSWNNSNFCLSSQLVLVWFESPVARF